MTKKEFYLRAMLAMASNEKFMYVEVDIDDDSLLAGTSASILNVEAIQMDAERLTREAEVSWRGVFEDDDNADMRVIADNIREINENGINVFTTDVN